MSQILRTPATYESVDGFLNMTLVMEETVFSTGSFTMTTRTYNGTVPGPTLVVSAGDTINLHFINQLADQGVEYVHNEFSAPDETNIHFHGLHVSGEEPSDDATLVLGPGESYAYNTTLPANHLPGTHWIHPHRHGSTAPQVGGGAAGAIIVRDPLASSLPAEYRNAREVLMVVQPIYHEKLTEIAQDSGDALFTTDGTGVTMLVNGQEQPSIPAVAGEWLRLRVIYASWEEEHLDLSIPSCTMKLIAKDGIFIPSVPRSIEIANIISGARSDIMVSCAQTSMSHELLDSHGNIIATIDTNSTSLVSDELPDWEVDYPAYLEDLSTATVLPQCSCPTEVGPDGMNRFVFEYDHVLHYYAMGEVAERDISSRDHPYHQHVPIVSPYKLIASFACNQAWSLAIVSRNLGVRRRWVFFRRSLRPTRLLSTLSPTPPPRATAGCCTEGMPSRALVPRRGDRWCSSENSGTTWSCAVLLRAMRRFAARTTDASNRAARTGGVASFAAPITDALARALAGRRLLATPSLRAECATTGGAALAWSGSIIPALSA